MYQQKILYTKANQAKWKRMSRDYLLNRENLMCTLVLIDSQLKLQKIDLEFMQCILPPTLDPTAK